MDLLQHLYDTYGNVTALDLQENHALLTKPYDPNLPIDSLFKQVEDASDFATAAGAPFTDRQIIDAAYLLILGTHVYKDECKEWLRRPLTEQTWTNFKADFSRAYRERKTLQKLEKQGSAGTHFGANTTETAPTETETLSSLTNATIETGSNVLNLAHQNAALRDQVNQLTSLVESLTTTVAETNQQLSALRQFSGQLAFRGGTNTGRGRGRNAGRGRYGNVRGRDPGFNANSRHYCWTHGLTRTSSHTSANCRTPADGHKTTVTFANRMGGSDFLCHLIETIPSNSENTEE